MRAESVNIQARVLLQQYDHGGTLPKGTLKRKFSTLVASPRQNDLSYPSPPMSSPPSPSRTQAELTYGDSRTSVQNIASREDPVTTFGPALATSLPTILPLSTSADLPQPSIAAAFPTAPSVPPPYQPPTPSLPLAGHVPRTFGFGGPRLEPNVGAVPVVPSAASEHGPAPTRGGRKAKAHVASACINCKRAHLSCDVQRPCGRCVATGKQVSFPVSFW